MTLRDATAAITLPIWDCPILVVDDVRWNRELIVAVLAEAGFSRVTQAGDGAEALAQIRRSPPDLVILDIMMPGINGYEVCRQLRADHAYADLPVLVQTALTGADDRNRAFQAGTTDLVCKPLDRTELLARVCIHLENRMMLRDLRHYRARLEGELAMARAVLEHLLPPAATLAALNASHRLTFRTHSVRASELGGDLWNVQPLDGQRIVLYLLDIAGSGVSAALNACRLNTIVEELLTSSDSPVEIVAAINERAVDLLDQNSSAAVILGILELGAGCFRYAAAAATPPLALDPSRNQVELGAVGGPALGADAGACYREHRLALGPEAVLVLFGSAVLGALNAAGELASAERLGEIIQVTLAESENSRASAFRQIDARLHEIAGPLPVDDQTLIWIERRAEADPSLPVTSGSPAA